MNATLKNALVYSAKNAVNAALTALGPTATWPSHFNFHSREGLEHVLAVAGSAVIARELMVWVPKLLKWSQATVFVLVATAVFLFAGCSPLENQARDALAASQGFLAQAQTNHLAECQATPKKAFPCATINQAIGAQNLAIDALETYCSWTPQDVADVAAGKKVHDCIEVKTAAGALSAALSNLNHVLKDYKFASGGQP